MRSRAGRTAVAIAVAGTSIVLGVPGSAHATVGGSVRAGASTTVTVLGRGTEPRAALAAAVTAGAHETATMSVSQAEDPALPNFIATSDPSEVPRLDETVTADVKQVSKSKVRVHLGIVGAANPASRFPSGLDPLAGFSFDVTFGRNCVFHKTLSGTTLADPHLSARWQLDRVADQLLQLCTPLPDGPIGVGAQWRVSSRLALLGGHFDQTATYTLQSVDGSRAAVTAVITQSAGTQKLGTFVRGVPEAIELRRFKVSGQRAAIIDLTRVLPLQSRVVLAGSENLSITEQGRTTVLHQTIMVGTQVVATP